MRHELRIWITKQLQSGASGSHKTSFSNFFQQICMNHVIQINESCHTYECAVSNMNESWHISMRDTESCRFKIFPHIWIGHVTHINESCHTHHRVMSHTSTSHVTHINESCHTHQRVMSHTSSSHAIGEWVMSRVNVWMSHVTCECVNGSCHVSICDLDSHRSRIRFRRYFHAYKWVVSYISTSHVTYMNGLCHISMSHVTYEWVMSHCQ